MQLTQGEKHELYQLFVKTVQPYLESICPDNQGLTWRDIFQEHFDEAIILVWDWYNSQSYYGKPEDILHEYFNLSAADSHKFLPLFSEVYNA